MAMSEQRYNKSDAQRFRDSVISPPIPRTWDNNSLYNQVYYEVHNPYYIALNNSEPLHLNELSVELINGNGDYALDFDTTQGSKASVVCIHVRKGRKPTINRAEIVAEKTPNEIVLET